MNLFLLMVLASRLPWIRPPYHRGIHVDECELDYTSRDTAFLADYSR
jgi:hypothetical protein